MQGTIKVNLIKDSKHVDDFKFGMIFVYLVLVESHFWYLYSQRKRNSCGFKMMKCVFGVEKMLNDFFVEK